MAPLCSKNRHSVEKTNLESLLPMLLNRDPQGYPQNLVVSLGPQIFVPKEDCK